MNAGRLVRLIVMSGVSGSGKSTYVARLAQQLNAMIVCPDSIRAEVGTGESDFSNDAFIWKQVVPDRLENVLHYGHAIFDATMLNPKARKPIVALGRAAGAFIECHYLVPDLAVAQRQNAARERKVPEDVITKQAQRWVVPSVEEGFNLVLDVSPAVFQPLAHEQTK